MKSRYSGAINCRPTIESDIILLLALACFCILTLCMQPLVDDWIYMSSSGSDFNEFWSCGGTPMASLGDALRSCAGHYVHSNGRLTDKLLIIFNLWPTWIARIVITTCFGIGLRCWLTLAGGSGVMRAPGFVAASLWLIFIILPWEHYILSLACGFNYLLPLAAGMPFMLWMLRGDHAGAGRCAVAFMAGWMHEGFSLGMLVGICVLLSIRRGHFGHNRWLLCTFFMAGTLVLMLAPGTFVRMDNAHTAGMSLQWLSHTLLTMPVTWCVALAAGIAIASRLIHRGGKQWQNDTTSLIFITITGIAAIIPTMLALERGRGTWFGVLLLIAASLQLVRGACPQVMRPHRIAGAILGTMLVAWLLWSASTQYAYARQADRMTAAMAAEPASALTWADVGSYLTRNPWQLRMTQPALCDYFYNMKAMGHHFHGGDINDYRTVLPARFRGKHYTHWDSLPGGTGVYGVFPVYYVPRLKNVWKVWRWHAIFSFDIGSAPLSPQNLWLKLQGTKYFNTYYSPPIMRVPRRRVSARDTACFTDPATGMMPDTLYFIYIEHIPRKLYNAPLRRVSDPII